MTRCTAVSILAGLAIASSTANAAELTRIVSSFEEDKPFGMLIEVGFERTQQLTKITREFHQADAVQDVTELRYIGTDSRLNLDLRLGIYKDLEFHFGVPVVFQQDESWRFARGTDETNSTIYRNCVQPNGDLLDPNCPTGGVGMRPLFTVDDSTNSYRGGLGDMTFGLAYAFFNQAKDDTKPTWIVGLDYTAPTSERLEPTVETAPDDRGHLGDKVHKYKFYTSFSKRVGAADPYFQLHYTLPYRGPLVYSNCDHPDPEILGHPENCGVPLSPWNRAETGIIPAHQGGIVFGTELNAVDDPAAHQKVAIDIRAIATYVSAGRYFNEMSDLFHKLLSTEDYLQLGGSLGLVAHPAEYVHLGANLTLLYNSEHTLTDESIGKDLNGNGAIDINQSPIELNPNFDWRTDMVSRRFRATESVIFRVQANLAFRF